MIFPTTNLAVMLLLLASLLCLALWTFPLKATFKWRYELFYYDVTWGVLLGAVVAAFTLGSMNSQELTFQDSLILTGYRKMAWALAAGGVFNLGNILLISATVVGRISLAFPASLGVALVLGMVWESVYGTRGNIVLGIGGAVVILGAIVAHAMGAMAAQDAAAEAAASAAATAAAAGDPKVKRTRPATKPSVSLVLAILSGILFACASPMMAEAQSEEGGLAAYAAVLLFAVGVFSSSTLYVPFMANFPVLGAPVPLRQYFKGAAKNHVLGVLAGFMVVGGLLAHRVATGAIPAVRATPLVDFIVGGFVAPLAAAIGIFSGDFRHGEGKGKILAFSGIVLFLVGLGLLGFGRFAS